MEKITKQKIIEFINLCGWNVTLSEILIQNFTVITLSNIKYERVKDLSKILSDIDNKTISIKNQLYIFNDLYKYLTILYDKYEKKEYIQADELFEKWIIPHIKKLNELNKK